MRTERLDADFCVVGGGMAGICAAVAAARGRLRTVLVHDRAVLGGNASSEVRVWVQGAGASGANKFAREGGIVGEIYLEQLWRNPECNPHLFDAVLLDWVAREPDLTVLLDTAAHECTMADPSRIASVGAFRPMNQTRYEISAPLFADTSGDGILGFLAGAEFRMGREGRDEYGEDWAPDAPDRLTLGASMYFHSKRVGRPVRYVPPAFAVDITRAGIPEVRIRRLHRTAEPFGCELWWMEYGGVLDTIYQGREVKRHLSGLVYGTWDYIKNSGAFADVEDLTLEWVGSLPGKRESRRFLGPRVLTQQDVVAQREFADGIGAAGWSIDLHPPGGIHSADEPSRHLHVDWVYNVPFGCLFSRNVANLLLGGRLISASHVAFGSIRVMGTGAMTGQAIGTAAAQCVAEGRLPGELAADSDAVVRLRRRLLRDGQHIVGLRNDDPDDLARAATVAASSTAVLDERSDDQTAIRPAKGWRLMVPLADPRTGWIELLLSADESRTLDYQVAVNDRIVNYLPNCEVGRGTLRLAPGPQWVRVDFPALPQPDRSQNVWLTFPPAERVAVRCLRHTTAGVLFEDLAFAPNRAARYRGTPCLRLARPQRLYEPANVIDGVARPEVFPHAWVSEPLDGGPQWIELTLARARPLGEIQITFNANVNQHVWTQLIEQDQRAIFELVRDFDVELFDDGPPAAAPGPDRGREGDMASPVGRFEVRDNHRHMVRLDGGATLARRVRVVCRRCWNHDRAEVHEIRLYPPDRA